MPGEASAPMTGFEATPDGRFGLWQITDGFLETRPGGELLDWISPWVPTLVYDVDARIRGRSPLSRSF
jgi:hypothetical protein